MSKTHVCNHQVNRIGQSVTTDVYLGTYTRSPQGESNSYNEIMMHFIKTSFQSYQIHMNE